MKKARFRGALFLALAAAPLFVGGVALIAFPAPAYSERENRTLASFPPLTAAAWFDGSAARALDDYAAERFPARDFCRAIYAAGELALGRREVHGVILCRDGSLIRRPVENGAHFSQNMRALEKLKNAPGLSLTTAVVPRRIDVRGEVLPALYDTAREREIWSRLPEETVTFLDCTADDCWYRTDHHWTAAGAYFAYARLGGVLGYAPFPREDFSPEIVSTSFLGTSDAAAGIPGISPDTVSVWHFAGEEAYRVRRDGEPAAFTGVYDYEKLRARDCYQVFLGGNCGLSEITRGEDDDRPVLLVVRDSFGSALLPFLARHYRIIAVDPRYRAADFAKLAAAADRVLVLCGMQTLTDGPFHTPLLRTI